MIFQNFVRAIIKAVGHRYIKRIPYNTPKGRRYRYIYRVSSTHQGRHAFDAEHLVEGTAFALHGEGESEFHGHITDVKGDMIKYVIDDGPRKGEEVTTSRQRLVDELNLVHGVQDKLTAERAKVKAAIAEARRAGHTGVVRRLERRLRALGGEPEAQPTEPRASGVADLIEAHRVGLLERAGALKEQWGALDRQADKEEIARLRDEEGALRGAALLAARAQRDGVDGFGAELQKLIDRIQASIERSDDAEHKARLTRDLEQRRQLLAIVEGAKPEAQPAEPEPEAQPAEPTESAAPKPTPRGTGKRKLTGKVDDYYRHMTTNPDSIVRKDLIERLRRDDRDIDRAVNVLGDATTTTFERRVGDRKSKIVSLIDGGFADERFDIGIGYSKLDDGIMLFARRGEFADTVGNLFPTLPVSGESEGLAILTLLRDKIDFADLNARTDANDLESIMALTKEIRDAWASIPDARDATNKLKVTMEEIARQKETLALEYHASRPYTQTEDTTTVSPNENALSRGADMSEGDRKKLARAIPDTKDRRDLDAQIHDGNIIGRTDGRRIHFMITEDTGDRARYSTQTGERLDDGLVAPRVSQVIPASNPNFTLSKDTIKHVLSVISSFKKKRLADRIVFTHNAQTNEQEIRVSLSAIHKSGDQGEVIATIPNMSESPNTIVDMQFLKDALKLAGDSASFTLGGAGRPLRIDADSGIHSVIMPNRP